MIVERKLSGIFFQGVEDTGGEGGDALITGGVEEEVELAVGAKGSDVGGEFLPHIERGCEIGVIEEAGVGTIHNDRVAERGLAEDEGLNGLAGGKGRQLTAEVLIEARGGNDAVAFGIEMDIDHDAIPGADRFTLFPERKEEVLGQAPVEKGTDLAVHTDDGEKGKLTDHSLRRGGGGDEAILRVAIEKDVNGVVGIEPGGRSLARGEENLTTLPGIEIVAVNGFPRDGEGVALADGDHCRECREIRRRQGGKW